MKNNAFNHFLKNKKILSPIFWEIKATQGWFDHIEYKSKNHKRPKQEAYIRYLCFLHFDFIIKKSNLYQDYLQRYEKFKIKRNKKIIVVNKLVTYYWFIATVNNNKQRVKILVKKVDWWDKMEYVSVIPVWKTTKYWPQLYLDNESDF